MKKIISVLIAMLLIAASVLAMIPVSAADTKTIDVDWSKLSYVIYDENGSGVDQSTFDASISITKTSSTLAANRISNSLGSTSYVSATQYEINANTDYTYEVKAKNNNENKYAGIPFAVDSDGYVYFVYGSFDNKNDSKGAPNTTSSYLISAKGDFDNKYPNEGGNEVASKYFAALQLDGGFASLKFEYDGLTVTINAKNSSGSYVKVGDSVTLPEGSKLTVGVFTRDATNSGNRTATVKDGKIIANNAASVTILEGGGTTATDKPASSKTLTKEIRELITATNESYKEANYTADSYKALKTALAAANEFILKTDATQDEADTIKAAIEQAVAALVPNTTLDWTKLEAAIKEAEALAPYEIEYTNISYAMVLKAIETAKDALANKDGKTQADIDALTEAIGSRIEGLVPSGLKVPRPEENVAATEAVVGTDAATEPVAEDGGCGSAVVTTAVVACVVATLGTALVVKKKED